jgi:hypothetical protein
MSARARKGGILLAALAAGVAIAIWLGIHLIVSGPLLRRWINVDPEELVLDYDEASAWVPGVLRLRGLTLRGSDPNVQWFFRMEKATISISVLDLLRKQFHATRVRAEGLVFRLREKQDKRDLSPPHLARLPEIPGFSDPPLKTPVKEPPPLSAKEKSRFWSIRVDDLVAEPAPDLWIEIYRFRGHARVSGGFRLRPHVNARIGPAAVDFLSGSFELAPGEPILTSASGHADCVIDPYDPDRVRGPEVWRRISGNIRNEGKLRDIRFLDYFLRRISEPRLAGGGGPARFSVAFDHGIGRGGGDFEVPRFTARYADGTLTGQMTGHWRIPGWDVERDDMQISGSRVELSRVTTGGTRHDEREWWGRFDIVSGRLRDGLTAQTAISCRDARPLYTLFRATLPGWAEGILKLDGVTGRARVRLATDLVEIENMEASGGKFRIAGRYQEKGKSRRGAFLVETGPLAVGLDIGASSHVKLFRAKKWFEEQSAR